MALHGRAWPASFIMAGIASASSHVGGRSELALICLKIGFSVSRLTRRFLSVVLRLAFDSLSSVRLPFWFVPTIFSALCIFSLSHDVVDFQHRCRCSCPREAFLGFYTNTKRALVDNSKAILVVVESKFTMVRFAFLSNNVMVPSSLQDCRAFSDF